MDAVVRIVLQKACAIKNKQDEKGVTHIASDLFATSNSGIENVLVRRLTLRIGYAIIIPQAQCALKE